MQMLNHLCSWNRKIRLDVRGPRKAILLNMQLIVVADQPSLNTSAPNTAQTALPAFPLPWRTAPALETRLKALGRVHRMRASSSAASYANLVSL